MAELDPNGGAMPATPKFQPHGHKPRVGPLVLPAEGRQGRPPTWPLDGRPTPAERKAWARLWATPQAVAWERLGCGRTVARYTRLLVRSEQPASSAAIHQQVTAFEDRLGLNPKSMRLLLWQVADPAPTGVLPDLQRRRYDHLQVAADPRDRLEGILRHPVGPPAG